MSSLAKDPVDVDAVLASRFSASLEMEMEEIRQTSSRILASRLSSGEISPGTSHEATPLDGEEKTSDEATVGPPCKKVDFDIEAALSKEEDGEDEKQLTAMERLELAYEKEKAEEKLKAAIEREKAIPKSTIPKPARKAVNEEDRLKFEVIGMERKLDEAMQKLKAATDAHDEAWRNAKEWERHATLPPSQDRPEEKRQLYARMWELQLEGVKNSSKGRAIAQDQVVSAQKDLTMSLNRLAEFRNHEKNLTFFERANKSWAWQTHLASIKMESLGLRLCGSH